MSLETFFFGVILALLYAELTGIYPGGIVVPAYLALHPGEPSRWLVTLGVALLSLASYRALSPHLFLFGRRRFALLLLLGVVWGRLALLASPALASEHVEVQAIGWIVPGLLANQLEKQRFVPTVASLCTVSIATFFLVQSFSWLGP